MTTSFGIEQVQHSVLRLGIEKGVPECDEAGGTNAHCRSLSQNKEKIQPEGNE